MNFQSLNLEGNVNMKGLEKKYEFVVNDYIAKSKYMWCLVHDQIEPPIDCLCISK